MRRENRRSILPRVLTKVRQPFPSHGREHATRGSTLVEFAFLVPVMFALVFGVIDFGRALYTYHFVSNAAREATRWASVRGFSCSDMTSCNATGPDISAYVGSIVPPGIDSSPSRLSVTTNWPPPPNNLPICSTPGGFNHPGCAVQVQVTYQFRFVLPFMPASGIPMTSTSQMIISQ
jgi:hypothetical protein